MTARAAAFAAGLAAILPPAAALAADPIPDPARVAAVARDFAGHRAVYELTLQQSRGAVVSAAGTMAYEVRDACDGWSIRQRLQLTIANRDSQPIDTASDYATYESKDGTQLNFRQKQVTEQAVTQQVEGVATLDHPGAGGGQVHYTLPHEATTALPPGTVFPTWHTATILAAAEGGSRFLSLPLFDGTGADGAQDSSVVVASWAAPAPGATPPPAPAPEMARQPSGRVHVAFYARDKHGMAPDYEVGMRYWRNGVGNDLRMDFGDFVVNGRLKEFALLKPRC